VNGTTDGDAVVVAGGRQSLHDARGYGRPEGDDVRLAPVEAAHLLGRGDLAAVDGQGFRSYAGRVAGAALRVYADCRDRGFRVRPARWAADPGPADLVVHERGAGPGGAVAHRLRVASDTDRVPTTAIDALADADGGALAVADGEGEVSYFGIDRPAIAGETDVALPDAVDAALLDDRVIAWDAPGRLHDRAFYGQPIGVDGTLHLALVEAAHLAGRGTLRLDDTRGGDTRERICRRGREREGEAFDRRLRVYAALRDRDVVPRPGYKFGADFRTYTAFGTADDPGHSDDLVWVRRADRAVDPRALALRVRLAGGVRKRTVFARTGATNGVQWIAAERLTP
jgi:tRNA-intron endonuclease